MYRVSNAETHWGQAQDDGKPRMGTGRLSQCKQELCFVHCFVPSILDSTCNIFRPSSICKINELGIILL